MNRYQTIIAIVAAVNVVLMLAFPPYVGHSLLRGASPEFEGFYFFLDSPIGRSINRDLLTLEIAFVVSNALAAWLFLASRPGTRSQLSEGPILTGILAFAAVNFAVVFLFPPFEHYSSLVREAVPGFDSFYFVFGDKMHRRFFWPLLHLECIILTVNLLAVWLLLNAVTFHRDLTETERGLLAAAHELSPQKLAELTAKLASSRHATAVELGRGQDRRHSPDPHYDGPERRHGERRRT